MRPGTSADLDENLTFVRGDKWQGISALQILEDGSPPAADASSARMQIRSSPDSNNILAELTTANAKITLVSGNLWTFIIPEQTLDLEPGTYVWQFETTDVNGKVQTYMQGSIEVLKDITR